MLKLNENEAFAGLVLSCDEKTLDLWWDRKWFLVKRTEELSKKKKGDWVWFNVDEKNVVTEYSDMPSEWRSRLSPSGDILLDINAVTRDYREYPDMRTPYKALPNTPWSSEVDYIEDPEEKLHRKRGIRLGKFHDATVKVVVDEAKERGDDDVTFHIAEVRMESPDNVQLDMVYAPWIYLLLKKSKWIADNGLDLSKPPDAKVKDFGIVVKRQEGGSLVWSKTGDWVYFIPKLRRGDQIGAGEVVITTGIKRPTKVIGGPRGFKEAYVETTLNVPMAMSEDSITFEDPFLGKMEVRISALERILNEKGLSKDDVRGKAIKVWSGPRTSVPTSAWVLDDSSFWEVKEIILDEENQRPNPNPNDDSYRDFSLDYSPLLDAHDSEVDDWSD